MLVHYSQTIYIKGTIEVNTSRIPFRKKWETKEIDSWFHTAGVLDETEVPAKIEDVITRLQNEDPETMQKINEGCNYEWGRNFSGWKFDRAGDLRIEYDVCYAKFTQNEYMHLKERLLATGDEEIVECNTWHDNCWGDCKCDACKSIKGENRLGKILMKIREEIRSDQTHPM